MRDREQQSSTAFNLGIFAVELNGRCRVLHRISISFELDIGLVIPLGPLFKVALNLSTHLCPVAEERRVLIVQVYGFTIILYSIQPLVSSEGLISLLLQSNGVFSFGHCDTPLGLWIALSNEGTFDTSADSNRADPCLRTVQSNFRTRRSSRVEVPDVTFLLACPPRLWRGFSGPGFRRRLARSRSLGCGC